MEPWKSILKTDRDYRLRCQADDLVSFAVRIHESDLLVMARSNLSRRAEMILSTLRIELQTYMGTDPDFMQSMSPLPVHDNAPEIARNMSAAAYAARVGPSAAVAGAIAQAVGAALLKDSKDVLVENGGDLYINTTKNRVVEIASGTLHLDRRIGLAIHADDTPLGVCTSSATIGHSLSMGNAEAATAIAGDAALADAAATAIGNAVIRPGDVDAGIEEARSINGVLGAVVISGGKLGAWGCVELTGL